VQGGDGSLSPLARKWAALRLLVEAGLDVLYLDVDGVLGSSPWAVSSECVRAERSTLGSTSTGSTSTLSTITLPREGKGVSCGAQAVCACSARSMHTTP
jgi:hypothetical protein